MSKDPNEPEIYEVLRKIRYDLSAAQAKITDAFTMLNSMKLPAPSSAFVCPTCKANLKGARALAFHVRDLHDGPEVPWSPEEEAAA